MKTSKRLSILSIEEIEACYGIPNLNHHDREILFNFDQEELSKADHEDDAVKINYLLQLGYFRAKQDLFNFTFQKMRDDTWFIINRYFPNLVFPKKQITKHYHYNNQKKILEIHGFRNVNAKDREQLIQFAKKLVKRHANPKFIFDELLNFSQQHQWIKPAYSSMQKIISEVLKQEQKRLAHKIATILDKSSKSAVDQLLTEEGSLHQLTLLKKDPKDFGTYNIRQEIIKQQKLSALYKTTKALLPQLKLSSQNIAYYAELAKFYDVDKLKRFSKEISRLYLLCFVHQRYFEVNDHLITIFLYRVNKYYQDAEQLTENKMLAEHKEMEQHISKAGKLVRLYTNSKIPDHDLRSEAFKIVPSDVMDQFVDTLLAQETRKQELQWHFLAKQSRSIVLNLRQLFEHIDFRYQEGNAIGKAIEFFRAHLKSNQALKAYQFENVPMDFIPKNLRKYVTEKMPDGGDKRRRIIQVNQSSYEFMLYFQIRRQLDSGQIFILNSIRYRRLEDELIDRAEWEQNKEKLIEKLNIPLFKKPIKELLSDLNESLTYKYHEVNQRIQNGENKHIKLSQTRDEKVTWKLPYKKQEDSINNPFYDRLSTININNVMLYVSNRTHFEKAFCHIRQAYTKKSLNIYHLIATLIAYGTGLGKGKMASISDMTYQILSHVSKNYFGLENLRDANDCIANEISKLPIFKCYTLSARGNHASFDGQKVRTRQKTIKARHSKKYFGQGRGVSSYKLVINHVPVNDQIIGLNEHESYYAFDSVYNNTSNIQIDAISGDMHSINCVNFAIMYLFGYQYMPRFTKLYKKIENRLVAFQSIDHFQEYLIRPNEKVNSSLMIREWDQVLRILVSLGMKETTQSVIVKKLSSYKRSNPTLKALIEFDRIFQSLYLLDYINDQKIRADVQRALNRGEALHQLISALRKVSDKKLPGKTEIELEIYNESNRLLANSIIYYNMDLLSQLLAEYKHQNNYKMVTLITRLSPVAWQHINLLGKYEFCSNEKMINLQEVVKELVADSKINF